MDQYINVRDTVEEFLKEHPNLKEHESLLLELSLTVYHGVGCDWPSCQDTK